jgi:hypothetical protein
MISTVLMAHPRRGALVAKLKETLPGAEVVWDRHGDVWETFRRSLRADPRASHLLLIQDDAILCAGLLAAVRAATRFSGEHPISLFLPRNRLTRHVIGEAIESAKKRGTPWVEMEGPFWGVGTVLPADHLPALVEWCNGSGPEGLDGRVARWYARQAIRCWYTVPSLVDHRPISEVPSLTGRTGNRRARWFAGPEPIELDWSMAPVKASL